MPPPCRFWAQGNCRNGEDCPFSHGGTPSAPPGSSSVPCRFFQAGNCAYGSACRFAHPGIISSRPAVAYGGSAHAAQDVTGSTATAGGGAEPAPASDIELPEDLSWWLGDAEDDAWDEEDEMWQQDGDWTEGTYTEAAEGSGTAHAWQGGASHLGRSDGEASHTFGTQQDSSGTTVGGATHTQQGEDGDWDAAPASVGGMTDPADLPLCSRYAATGNCPRGDDCHMIHGDLCATCMHHTLHPYNPEEAEQHREECQRRHDRLAARLRSAEVECSICMEQVLSKQTPSERRFGLMSCEHAFCLACIRSWRTNGTADLETAVRTCPLCRATTHFVVPSTVWPVTQEEKDSIISGYKAKLGDIHCRHYARGEGTCPFGTSCFYRHVRPDGTEDPKDPSMLRRYVGQEGEVRVVSGVRLSDFLETSAAQLALNPGRRRLLARRGNRQQ